MANAIAVLPAFSRPALHVHCLQQPALLTVMLSQRSHTRGSIQRWCRSSQWLQLMCCSSPLFALAVSLAISEDRCSRFSAHRAVTLILRRYFGVVAQRTLKDFR
jgi:hypothetical protein